MPFDGAPRLAETRSVAGKKRRRVRAANVDRGHTAQPDERSLELRTHDQCNEEYEARWGEPFLGGAGSVGGSLIRRVEGLHGRAKTERSARACYERLRKRAGPIGPEVRRWLAENDYMTGHLAAYVLSAMAHTAWARARGKDLPPLSAHRDAFALLMQAAPGDSFSDTTFLLFDELGRPPVSAEPTNREVAVILILMEEAPAGWAAYERRAKRDGVGSVTPAMVIHDVEKRVRDVIGSDDSG